MKLLRISLIKITSSLFLFNEAFNKNNIFITNGEVLLVNKLETSNFIVKYYSDGTAIKILTKTNTIIRVAALTNGEYGIDKDGNINTSAKTREVKESKVKDYPWGKVIYYSDGSASIINSKMDMFVISLPVPQVVGTRTSSRVLTISSFLSNKSITGVIYSKANNFAISMIVPPPIATTRL